MGNNITKGLSFPSYNKYIISYCKQKDYKVDIITTEYINLSYMIPQDISDSRNIIYYVTLGELTKQGYSLKEHNNFYFESRKPLVELINSCNSFSSSDSTDILDDLIIKPECYVPTINNIKKILNNKKIIIAGIIIDLDLVKSISDEYSELNQVTDIICIIGYTQDSLLIKTAWKNEIIELNNSFIENIKEIWTININ